MRSMLGRVFSSHHYAWTLALLMATVAASRVVSQRKGESLAAPLSAISFDIAGSHATENPPLTSGVLKQLKSTSYLTRTYRKANLETDLFIAFYAQQRAGESMHSPKNCLPAGGWELRDYDVLEIPAGDRKVKINKYSISQDDKRRIVLYWYQSRERIFASEYLGKILLARDALMRNSTAAAIVRIMEPDQPGALEYGIAFAAAVIPQVHRCFGE